MAQAAPVGWHWGVEVTEALRRRVAVTLGLVLAACTSPEPRIVGPVDSPTREFPMTGIRDSAYALAERGAATPAGYGLYSVLLTRSANRNAVRLLAEVLASNSSARDAVIPRGNLNLITIPVKHNGDAAKVAAAARERPEPTASTLLQQHYDFGQAALLLASICRPERGAALMKACGSATPDGPILVTSQLPFDPAAPALQRLLVVNLGNVAPGAVPEIVEAYRRQIQRPVITDREQIDSWRLAALNVALNAARMLPDISKAYAGGK